MSQAPPRADGRPARLWGPPPWLWVTLGLLAAQVPTLTDTLTWDAQGLGTEHGRDPAPLTALAQTLVQLLPTLFLLAGGLALVLPRVRARWVERHYGLGPAGIGAPVLDQMRGFLTDRVPSTELRVTRRRDMLARVYPGGGRTTRVGVFYPLVGLWESDREAAEAVLLHELGHIRCGEQHVAGLGSPFVALVKAWPYVFAVFCVLPVGLLLAAGNLAAHLLFAETVLVVLALPKVLLIVVGALWSAELAADRYAAGTAVRAAQWRALNALAPSRHRPLGRPTIRRCACGCGSPPGPTGRWRSSCWCCCGPWQCWSRTCWTWSAARRPSVCSATRRLPRPCGRPWLSPMSSSSRVPCGGRCWVLSPSGRCSPFRGRGCGGGGAGRSAASRLRRTPVPCCFPRCCWRSGC